MQTADITTDYLVVGAGINGLAFADELFTRTKATITIVDERDAPGGHWNDAYSFVKLHQPSTFYGVESTELSDYELDKDGPNEGFLSLATKPEITSYCQTLLRNRLIPSGRVRYLPMTQYQPDGSLLGLLSGKRLTVDIKKKLVDASIYTNSIPMTHTRAFTVDSSVTCIPPNDLPLQAKRFTNYTVLGSGKTGIDTCIWLLTHGTDPDRIRWIVPNDYWFVNRAKVQPTLEFFDDVFGTFVATREDIGAAENALDLALRHEKSGMFHRLDPSINPHSYHAAVVSTRELEQLRRIQNVVRKGRVTHITPTQLTLTNGTDASSENTLYIDCTASALRSTNPVPVFQPDKIAVQLIRFPQIPFSAALIAFLESLPMSDEERNSFTRPVPFMRTIDDYVKSLVPDFQNRAAASRNKEVREWVRQSRLEGFTRVVSQVKPDDEDKLAILARFKKATDGAIANLPKLIASTRGRATL